MKKRIVIVGSGPGGLTSAMMLAHRGYDVTLVEKEPVVGGRNAALQAGDFWEKHLRIKMKNYYLMVI